MEKRFQVVASFDRGMNNAWVPIGDTYAETADAACSMVWSRISAVEREVFSGYTLSAIELTDELLLERELAKLPTSDPRSPSHNVFLICERTGHRPYAVGSDNMVYSCYCGQVQPDTPFSYYQPVTRWPWE